MTENGPVVVIPFNGHSGTDINVVSDGQLILSIFIKFRVEICLAVMVS